MNNNKDNNDQDNDKNNRKGIIKQLPKKKKILDWFLKT